MQSVNPYIVYKGNTSGSITLVPINIPCQIVSFFFVSRSLLSIGLNAYVVTAGGGGNRAIIPLTTTLLSGAMYVPTIGTTPIFLNPNDYIYIVAGGNVDYYFNILPL